MFQLLRNVLSVSLVFALIFSMSTYASVDNLHTSKKKQIDAYIEKWRENFNVPTVQLGILENGKLSYEKTYGDQLSSDNSLVINSMSKTMTAYGVMLLVQNGQLSVDDPMSKYLPNFAVSNSDITIRDLLNHSSGLPGDDQIDNGPFDYTYSSVTDEAMAVSHTAPVPSQKGTFHYSSVGYIYLGSIIEKVSHMSYANFMKKNVFNPIGMNQTSAIDTGTIAPGYVSFFGVNIPFNNTPFNVGGGSVDGIHSTVGDLAKFLVAQTKDYPLQQKYRDLMVDSKARVPFYAAGNVSLGLGWPMHNGDGSANDPSYIFNGGTGRGYQSEMSIEPTTGNGIILLSNKIANLSDGILGDGIWIGYLFEGIRDIYHDKQPPDIHSNIDTVKNIVLISLLLILAGAIYAVHRMKHLLDNTRAQKVAAILLVIAGLSVVPLLIYASDGATFLSIFKYVPDIMLTAFILTAGLISIGVILFLHKPKPRKKTKPRKR